MGCFFPIKEEQAQDFANRFFDELDMDIYVLKGKVSPKILIVKPAVHLPWQYYHRRAEFWQVYKGEVGIIRSDNDTITERPICEEMGIGLIDGLGDKIQSSSRLVNNFLNFS